jgi:hypothetical protein
MDDDAIRTSRSADGYPGNKPPPSLKGASSGWFWGTEKTAEEDDAEAGVEAKDEVGVPGGAESLEGSTSEALPSPSTAGGGGGNDVEVAYDDGELPDLIAAFMDGIDVPRFLDVLQHRVSAEETVALRDFAYALNALNATWDFDKVLGFHQLFRSDEMGNIVYDTIVDLLSDDPAPTPALQPPAVVGAFWGKPANFVAPKADPDVRADMLRRAGKSAADAEEHAAELYFWRTPRMIYGDHAVAHAVKIQCRFRIKIAYKAFAKMARAKCFLIKDPVSGEFYYHNICTKHSSWERPSATSKVPLIELAISSLGMKPPQESHYLHQLLKEGAGAAHQAASMIQGLFRSQKARTMLRSAIAKTFEKLWDKESGKYYYFNSKTGASQWEKPPQLGAGDLEVSASDASKKSPRETEELRREKEKETMVAADMSVEMAASFIQRSYRSRRALMRMREMIKSVFEKVLDPVSGTYFYYNKKTGESKWTKPKNLGSEDISVSPRDPTGLSPRDQAKKKKENMLKAEDMTIEMAASFIQRSYRSRRALMRMREMIKSVFEKVITVH